MTVKLIRMSSGEDVVATVVSEDDDFVNLKDCIVAVATGSNQLGFAPWSPIVSETVEYIPVNKKFVVYTTEPSSNVVAQYNQLFNKVIVPSNKIIV